MFCQNCGTEISEQASFCSNCGAAQHTPTATASAAINEENTVGWGVLGFFVPLLGLILYLIWIDTRPKASKSSGIGALIGFIASIVFVIFLICFMILLVERSTNILPSYWY
ncbi:MAG: zinc ribbon domain-containing protein [Erysipelotrichaceae bacterium]|nr:zinc ribbon domain-containing protein [Erysipelotrichaceae bacterium]